MKLSNKILLGFFGFVFLYITAAFAELRLSGSPNVIDDKNSVAETVDISGITYLILNDLDKNVHVIGSDRAQLEVRSMAGDLMKTLKYEISGDTLTLSNLQSESSKMIRISVFVPKTGLKEITVKASSADVEGLQQSILLISQNAGRIWMSDCKIARIQTDLSNQATLNISNTSLDTLAANIERSSVIITSPVGLLQGLLKNDAYLRVDNIREIQLKKDESSRLNMSH